MMTKEPGVGSGEYYTQIEMEDGTRRSLTKEEKSNANLIPKDGRLFQYRSLKRNEYSKGTTIDYEFKGKIYHPGRNRSWCTTKAGLDRLTELNRIEARGNSINYVRYLDDFPAVNMNNLWKDIPSFASFKIYAVQTNTKVIERCILLTTDPGDIVFDPTCGSGTTAMSAEKYGRRWITCDTSRVAITVARRRLITANFDYFELAQPKEGIGSGFKYKTIKHITLESLANGNEHDQQEVLYDQPLVDKSKCRMTGPFTVEAIPAPVVKPIDDIETELALDFSVTRTDETIRQYEWQDELLKTGIRCKGGQRIEFSCVETMRGCRYLHADAETKGENPERVAIVFGPDHAPLEQRQVELAIEEAHKLVPRPKIIVFAAFQFDAEAGKDIDEINWPNVKLIKAQMNADLHTYDLKEKRSTNESFWLIGQPDVVSHRDDDGKWRIEVKGFDYFDTVHNTIRSGGSDCIAMWILDTNYDGRSLYPCQIFFPTADKSGDWTKLAKNLKGEIDEDLIQAYHSTISLPFKPRDYKRAAVKIIDNRGIESLKIINLE